MLIIIASIATINAISIIISTTRNTIPITTDTAASTVSNISNESHLLLVDRVDWIHEVMN